MTRIFHWFFMWKMDPMSGCNIRLVFTLPPRDSTLQYKRCVQLWNNSPYITPLVEVISLLYGNQGCRSQRLSWPFMCTNNKNKDLIPLLFHRWYQRICEIRLAFLHSVFGLPTIHSTWIYLPINCKKSRHCSSFS